MKPHPVQATNPMWLSIRFSQVLRSVLSICRYSAHDHVRGLVAILPHVVAAQVERRSGEGILRQWDVAEHVLGLCRPRKHPALAQ